MMRRSFLKQFYLPAFAGMILGLSGTTALAAMEDYPEVVLKGLDKSTARTTEFTAKVGDTIEYGPLYVRIQACRKNPPIETPESAAFIQVWEVPPETEKSEWVFSGWMFASSPALSGMDHPVYDIWVIDCTGKKAEDASQTEEKTEEKQQDEPETQKKDQPTPEGADSLSPAEQ